MASKLAERFVLRFFRFAGGDLTPSLLALEAREVPVYAVGVGLEPFPRDLAIERVVLPSSVLAGAGVLAEVDVRVRGLGGRAATVTAASDGQGSALQGGAALDRPRNATRDPENAKASQLSDAVKGIARKEELGARQREIGAGRTDAPEGQRDHPEHDDDGRNGHSPTREDRDEDDPPALKEEGRILEEERGDRLERTFRDRTTSVGRSVPGAGMDEAPGRAASRNCDWPAGSAGGEAGPARHYPGEPADASPT